MITITERNNHPAEIDLNQSEKPDRNSSALLVLSILPRLRKKPTIKTVPMTTIIIKSGIRFPMHQISLYSLRNV